MKYRFLLILSFLVACGGSLTQEQREQMREGAKLQKIQRVTQAEILEAAFSKGREATASLKDSSALILIDSLEKALGIRIKWIQAHGKNAHTETEKQILDAYLEGASTGSSLEDNVQKTEGDSLFFTKPITQRLPDNRLELSGLWGVWISQKKLILDMD